jgi:hypothetical protein
VQSGPGPAIELFGVQLPYVAIHDPVTLSLQLEGVRFGLTVDPA